MQLPSPPKDIFHDSRNFHKKKILKSYGNIDIEPFNSDSLKQAKTSKRRQRRSIFWIYSGAEFIFFHFFETHN